MKRTFWLIVGLIALSAIGGSVNAATPKEYAVQVEATVVANPPSITLSWPLESKATGYEISRKLRADTTWGTAIAKVPGTATSWTDNTVSVRAKYEYQIKRTSTIAWVGNTSGVTGYGYVCAGMYIPVVDHRGTVILVVDKTMATPLSIELSRLQNDLIGDGWSVIRHDADRTATVTSVKALIKTDYDAAPGEVKSVFLFGHIPVARSGNIYPVGHSDVHKGSFPADVYYGDMDGVWTDNRVNVTSATDAIGSTYRDVWNIPGDGKFDQSYIPPGAYTPGVWVPGGKVELEVGRVDLWGLSDSFKKSETELLRQYLNKDHNHRHAVTVLPRRGLITDGFGEFGGVAPAQNGWRAWSALFGKSNTSEGNFDTLNTQQYLGYNLCGGGSNNSCDTVTTAKIAQQDPKAAFWMMFGSHFGDWNYTENILRAPLATSTGLTNVYAGFSNWYLHTMSLGGTIGEAAKIVQDNSGFVYIWKWLGKEPLYAAIGLHTGEVSDALMGDPTLRLHAVAPVTNVMAVNGKGNVAINWTASTDTVVGYNVYRSTSANGPFTRITNKVVTGNSFTDATVTANTTYTYMVRAIKLETSAGGTYYNLSQGIFVTTTYGD